MRALIASFVAGLIFALGLGISGMVQPEKVVAFLDVGGDWDPALALVMVGAIGVNGLLSWRTWAEGRARWSERLHLAPFNRVDAPLIVGSALFGVGWGLMGYCPAPAVVAAGAGEPQGLLFLAAMVGGMGLYTLLRRLTAPEEAPLPEG